MASLYQLRLFHCVSDALQSLNLVPGRLYINWSFLTSMCNHLFSLSPSMLLFDFFFLKLHEALDNKFLTFDFVLFTVLLVGNGQHLCQPDHLLLDECQVLFQEQTELPLVVSIKGFGTTLTRSFLAARDSYAGPRRDKKSMRCLLTLQRHWIICKIPQNILTTPSPFYDSLILDLFVLCDVAPLWSIGQSCPNSTDGVMHILSFRNIKCQILKPTCNTFEK